MAYNNNLNPFTDQLFSYRYGLCNLLFCFIFKYLTFQMCFNMLKKKVDVLNHLLLTFILLQVLLVFCLCFNMVWHAGKVVCKKLFASWALQFIIIITTSYNWTNTYYSRYLPTSNSGLLCILPAEALLYTACKALLLVKHMRQKTSTHVSILLGFNWFDIYPVSKAKWKQT